MARPKTSIRAPVDRTVLLFGEVDVDMTKVLVEEAMKLSVEDKTTPINVIINTTGGDVYESLAMHDFIRGSQVPIYTYGMGAVMSAGTIILVSGHRRYMYPNCHLMIHEPYFEESSIKAGELNSSMSHNRDLTDKFYQIYAKHTKKTASYWSNAVSGKTMYWSAETAMKNGFIDGIVSVK